MYLTAKKQNNYPLILPLQMLLPFIMEQAEAMKEAIPAFKSSQPVKILFIPNCVKITPAPNPHPM